jgi:enoyl-CoA hydratase
MSDAVRLERYDQVAYIVLDRPERLNRIDTVVREQLVAVANEFAARTDIRAVVFAATGPMFSAGSDFDFILNQNATADKHSTIKGAVAFFSSFLSIPCPVVVALHGDVAGVCSSLVLSADAVVSHPTVLISDPHVVLGPAAGDGGWVSWPMSAGLMLAKRHLLTGEPMQASDAHRIGLISDLVDTPEEVLVVAQSLARRIAALPPIAVQGTKFALNHLIRQRLAEVGEIAAAMEYEGLKSQDFTEVAAAIREQRAPRYIGT